jgi:atypical dual specificity phosphatase
MWEWTLNWGFVRDDLVIGSCPVELADLDQIRDGTGATAVLSLQRDECHARFDIDREEHCRHGERLGLVMANVPLRDFDWEDQRRRLPAAVRALHRLREARHRVYIHCTAGINRAPLVVYAYLVWSEGLTENEALRVLRAGRPEAEPYLDAYQGSRQDLLARHREAIAKRAYALWCVQPGPTSADDWYRAERAVLRVAF